MTSKTKDNIKMFTILIMEAMLMFFFVGGLVLHIDAWHKILSDSGLYWVSTIFGLIWVVISFVLLPLGAVSGWMFYFCMI